DFLSCNPLHLRGQGEGDASGDLAPRAPGRVQRRRLRRLDPDEALEERAALPAAGRLARLRSGPRPGGRARTAAPTQSRVRGGRDLFRPRGGNTRHLGEVPTRPPDMSAGIDAL